MLFLIIFRDYFSKWHFGCKSFSFRTTFGDYVASISREFRHPLSYSSIKVNIRSFREPSPCLWNQFPCPFGQPLANLVFHIRLNSHKPVNHYPQFHRPSPRPLFSSKCGSELNYSILFHLPDTDSTRIHVNALGPSVLTWMRVESGSGRWNRHSDWGVNILTLCNSQKNSVRPSFHHIPMFCPVEWRYDRAVFRSR